MTLTRIINKKIATLAVALCGLGIGLTAGAQQASAATAGVKWFWTESAAEQALYDDGLYSDAFGHESVVYADCLGRGEQYRGAKFSRFYCYVETAQDPDAFVVKLRVRGEFAYKVDWVGYM